MATTYDKASLVMIPSGYKDDKLYSIKPTDGSGDFTFSRDGAGASPATRVNASGLIEKGRENVLLQSNTFSSGSWSKIDGTLTSGQTGYDGSSDAWQYTTTSTAGSIYQLNTFSGVQTFSVYAKGDGSTGLRMYAFGSVNKSAFFDLNNGIITSGDDLTKIESLGGGWYRCSIAYDQTNTQVRLYTTNAAATTNSAGTIFIQDMQLESGLIATSVIETTTAPVSAGLLGDMPRLDYSGGATCPSLLLEPSRVNLLGHSEYFGDSNFLKDGVTATANYSTSPEGVQNAYSVVESAVLEDHRILWNTGFAGTGNANYSLSVYVKKIAGQPTRHIYWMCQEGANAIYAHFDMDNFSVNQQSDNGTGSIVDADIIPVGNDWYRLTLSGVVSANTGTYYNQLYFETTPRTGFSAEIYTGNGTSGFELYGWQIESGSYPTSYIPTYGSASTRGKDFAGARTDMQDFLGTNEGTWYMQFKDMFFDITGTGQGSVNLVLNSSQQIEFIQDGNFQYKITLNNSTAVSNLDGEDKVAIAWGSDGLVIYVNGESAFSTASTTYSVAYYYFELTRTDRVPRVDMKQLLFFRTRLTNAELAALTA